MKNTEEIVFLSGNGNHHLGSKILTDLSELLGRQCTFNHINFSKYPDGELDNRIVNHENINGKVVVFYQSMFSHELVHEAEDLLWAIKHQYGARYVIGIFPFLLNRRQDPAMKEGEKEKWSKKIAKPHEIQRLKKTIHLLKVCGVDEMLVATPHSNEMSKACDEYGIKFHEINPSKLFATTVQTFIPDEEDQKQISVYAPDAGSIPRAIDLARILNNPVVFNLKNRATNDKTSILNHRDEEIENLEKEFKDYYNFENIHYINPALVENKNMIMIEDEVASGGTANDTARLLQKMGAKSVILFATHPVLTLGWRNKLFFNDPFTKIAMTDTIPRNYEKRTGGKIFDISLSQLFASSLFKIIEGL